MLPELLGPDAEPFDLHFTGPDGARRDGAQIIQVSNNPYVLSSLAGFGSRARLDTGELGIAAAEIHGAADVAAFVAAESAGRLDRFRGWTEWTRADLHRGVGRTGRGRRRRRGAPARPTAGVPALPGAVRIRIPTSAPGLLAGRAQGPVDVVDARCAAARRRRAAKPHRGLPAVEGAGRDLANSPSRVVFGPCRRPRHRGYL